MSYYRSDGIEPMCEMCGEEAYEISTEHAGLCTACFEREVRQALEPLMGKICGSLSIDSEGNPRVCLATFGTEHIHGR